MWRFCLAVGLLLLRAERGFGASRGRYVLLRWPLGRVRDQVSSSLYLHCLALGPILPGVVMQVSCRGKTLAPGNPRTQVVVPTLPFAGRVTLRQLPLLSESQLPHL